MNNLQAVSVSKIIVILALLAISACAHNSAPTRGDAQGEKALVERVTERWQAMEKKDFAATYKFATPNYRRIFPKALYLHKFSYALDLELTGIEVVNYDASAAVASVAVRVMSKPAKQTRSSAIFGATPVTVRESWIFENGEWWHNAKD